MSWIDTISPSDATGKLSKLYDRVSSPQGEIDNIMLVHSLRPHSLEGHMILYKNVLHHTGNSVPKWFLEVLGVWVSMLNGCAYCVEHHYAGLARIMDDKERVSAIRTALETREILRVPVRDAEKEALRYAQKLTERPKDMIEQDVISLRAEGFSDGEILEINQVVSYFAYANRTVLGLGCSTHGDVLGLSPSNSADPEDWSHV